jgi:hypothetical protein
MKKGANRFVILILIAIVVFGGNAFWRQIDKWRFPWAYGGDGRPTLTGTWVGSLRTGSGASRGVMLDVSLPGLNGGGRRYRRTKYGTLEGTARSCDEAGQIRSFTVSGAPEDRAASRIHLGATPVEKPEPEGLTISNLQGAWDRADVLHVETHFVFRKNGGAITGAEYPDTEKAAPLHLTRGGDPEFQAVCARIKQSG